MTTIHLRPNDTALTFLSLAQAHGMTMTEALKLIHRQPYFEGWPVLVQALRTVLAKQERDAAIDATLPPADPGAKAADLLWN